MVRLGRFIYDPAGEALRSGRLSAEIIEEERRRREEEERKRREERERRRRAENLRIQGDSTRFRGLEGQELRAARARSDWMISGARARAQPEKLYGMPVEEGGWRNEDFEFDRKAFSALRGTGSFAADSAFLEGELSKIERDHPLDFDQDRNKSYQNEYGLWETMLSNRRRMERERNPTLWGNILGSPLWHDGLGGALLGFGREALRAGWYFGGLVGGRDSLRPLQLPQSLESEYVTRAPHRGWLGGKLGTVTGSFIPGATGMMPEIHGMLGGTYTESFPGERLLTVATTPIMGGTSGAAAAGRGIGFRNSLRLAMAPGGDAVKQLQNALERFAGSGVYGTKGPRFVDPSGLLPGVEGPAMRPQLPQPRAGVSPRPGDRVFPDVIRGGADYEGLGDMDNILLLEKDRKPGWFGELTKVESAKNVLRGIIMRGVTKVEESIPKAAARGLVPDFIKIPDHPVVSWMTRTRERVIDTADSLSTILSAKHSEALGKEFRFDARGRIQGLKGIDASLEGLAPTIQDVAARLRKFQDSLTTDQVRVLYALREDLRPYTKVLDDEAVDLGSRLDVEEGGFYIPRGTTALEDVVTGETNLGAQGFSMIKDGKGKEAFEHAAMMPSMTKGIEKKYRYSTVSEALKSYGAGVGRVALRKHFDRVMQEIRDPQSGKPFAWKPATPDDLNRQIKDVGNQIKAGNRQIDALQKAIGGYNIPTVTVNSIERLFPRVKGALSAIGRVTMEDVFRAAKDLRKSPTIYDMPSPGTIKKLQKELDDARLAAEVTKTAAAKENLARIMRQLGFTRYRWKKGRAILEGEEAPVAPFTAEGKFVVVTQPDKALMRVRAEALKEYRDLIKGKKVKGEKGFKGGLIDALKESKEELMEKRRVVKQTLKKGTLKKPLPTGQLPPQFISQHSVLRFPDESVAAAQRWARGEGRPGGRAWPVIATATALNSLHRGLRATLDLSAGGIQGLLGLADDPRSYGKAWMVQLRSLGSEKAIGQFFNTFDALAQTRGRLTSSGWAKFGVRVRSEVTEYMIGAAGEAGVLARVGGLPVIKQANRAFGNFGDALRLNWADNMLSQELKMGRTIEEIASSGDMKRIADIANKMTGYTKGRTGGWLGDLVLFAPRFLQSRLETVTEAAMGLRPGATLSQKSARRAMLRMVGIGYGLTYLANAKLGNDTDTRPLIKDKKGRTKWNPNFLRIRWAGRDWSIFGTWDSLARGIVLTAMGRPQEFVRGMPSGIVSVAWDTLSGKSGIGESVPDYETQWKEWGAWLMTEFTPFAAEEGFEGIGQFAQGMAKGDLEDMLAGGSQAFGEFVGVKSSPESLTDYKDIESLRRHNHLYRDLPSALGPQEGAMEQKRIDASEAVTKSPAAIRQQEEQERREEKLRATGPTKEMWTRWSMEQSQAGDALKLAFTTPDGEIPDHLLLKAVGDFKKAISASSRGIFDLTKDAEPDPDKKVAYYLSLYRGVELEMLADQVTPNWDKFDDERQRILLRAKEHGVSEDFLKFRAPFDDPDIEKHMKKVEAIRDAIRPYWEVYKNHPSLKTPEWEGLYRRWRLEDGHRKKAGAYDNAPDSPFSNAFIFSKMKGIDRWVREERKALREDPIIDSNLIRFYGYGAPRTPLGAYYLTERTREQTRQSGRTRAAA